MFDDRKQAGYNLHNYVKDANESFDQSAFNEVDGLVMTQVSNMDLGSSGVDLYSGKSKSLKQIYDEMHVEGTPAHDAYLRMGKDERALIDELGQSPRFQNMTVSNYIKDPSKNGVKGFPSVGEEQSMEQFAAATITYEQGGKTYNYVSYRATDGTSDGWSEDLAMLYCMDTQAQSDSANYMNIIAGMTEGYITGGGHSKGAGNFEYAYLFCDPDVRERIVKGYVYDGPGLTDEVLANTDYYEDYKRITEGSYICPQDSIIGQLLHESENATFIHSVESGFSEHDPYSWEIDKDTKSFVPDEQTDFSRFINDALDNSVRNMSQEEREAFFAFVSYLLYHNGGEGIDGLGDLFAKGWKDQDGNFNWGKLEEIWDVLSADWANMTPEERKAFLDSLGSIVAGLVATTFDYIKDKVETWIEEKKKQIEQAIKDAWVAASAWLSEKREQFRKFLDNVYVSVVNGLKKVAGWLKNLFSRDGGHYVGPQVILDTYKMRSYAQRIQGVNRRIGRLDQRMDSLYWQVGLADLWSLVQADWLTKYSKRLEKCAGYLNDTASDFEKCESELIGSI